MDPKDSPFPCKKPKEYYIIETDTTVLTWVLQWRTQYITISVPGMSVWRTDYVKKIKATIKTPWHWTEGLLALVKKNFFGTW